MGLTSWVHAHVLSWAVQDTGSAAAYTRYGTPRGAPAGRSWSARDRESNPVQSVAPEAGIEVTAEKEDAELSAEDTLIAPANAVHQIETVGETEAEWLLAAPAGGRFLFADGREASPPWAK